MLAFAITTLILVITQVGTDVTFEKLSPFLHESGRVASLFRFKDKPVKNDGLLLAQPSPSLGIVSPSLAVPQLVPHAKPRLSEMHSPRPQVSTQAELKSNTGHVSVKNDVTNSGTASSKADVHVTVNGEEMTLSSRETNVGQVAGQSVVSQKTSKTALSTTLSDESCGSSFSLSAGAEVMLTVINKTSQAIDYVIDGLVTLRLERNQRKSTTFRAATSGEYLVRCSHGPSATFRIG